MKTHKVLYILIAFVLLFVTFADAETENNRINFTVSVENGEIRLIAPTVPEQSIAIELPEGIESRDLFVILRPDIIQILTDCFAETVTSRSEETAKVIKGFFSGDLFEKATEKQVIDINKEDIQLILSDLISQIQKKEIKSDEKESFERILRWIITQIYGNNTITHISIFDHGRYLTVNVCENQQTKLIISADLTEKDAYRIVIGRGAENAVYYDEIISKKNNMETDYVFSLFTTTAPAFRMVSEQDCVHFTEIKITDQGNGAFEFEGEIQSVLLPGTARISGKNPVGEKKIHIEISLGDQAANISEILLPILFKLLEP